MTVSPLVNVWMMHVFPSNLGRVSWRGLFFLPARHLKRLPFKFVAESFANRAMLLANPAECCSYDAGAVSPA
jgi:hypothetical protein